MGGGETDSLGDGGRRWSWCGCVEMLGVSAVCVGCGRVRPKISPCFNPMTRTVVGWELVARALQCASLELRSSVWLREHAQPLCDTCDVCVMCACGTTHTPSIPHHMPHAHPLHAPHHATPHAPHATPHAPHATQHATPHLTVHRISHTTTSHAPPHPHIAPHPTHRCTWVPFH